MALFEWSDDYSVGVPSLDQEHKELVGMLNALHDAMAQGLGQEHLGEILDGLVAYTAKHFAHEEELFATYHYSETEQHIAEHQLLVSQVMEFQVKFKEKRASVNMELMRFLKDWLIGHILGSDKRYSELLVSHRVA